MVVFNQQSERSDLSDEIYPLRWKRMPSSDFITVMHTRFIHKLQKYTIQEAQLPQRNSASAAHMEGA